MRRLALALLLLASPLAADTVIFTETCASNPQQNLDASTTVTVGTAWSALIALYGVPGTRVYKSGTVDCTSSGATTNIGLGYTTTPTPATDAYYADFQWIDGGVMGATNCHGMLVNYVDVNNYYACIICDDATSGQTKIVKITGGAGSTLTTGTQGTVPTNDTIQCKIDYSGANPVITFTNTTDSLQFLTATDSSSPLTKTAKAGYMTGATPQAEDDVNNSPDMDTFRVVEVSAAAAGVPRPPWFGRAY